jgi:hypothetical protein
VQTPEPGEAALGKMSIITNIHCVIADCRRVPALGSLGPLAEVKIKDPEVLAGLKTGGQIDLTETAGLVIAVTQGAAKKLRDARTARSRLFVRLM